MEQGVEAAGHAVGGGRGVERDEVEERMVWIYPVYWSFERICFARKVSAGIAA